MRALFLIALLLGGILIGTPTAAADLRGAARSAIDHSLPFPRSERAEAVWASGGCWTGCTAGTDWALVDCLAFDSQGRCLARADVSDRACQRACRSRGGPYLPLD